MQTAGTKAGGAGENAPDPAAFQDPDALKVRKETAVGRLVRVADGFTGHRTLATFITGECHGDRLECEASFIPV